MTLRCRIARAYWRVVFQLSERHTFSGCRVGILLPQGEARPILEQKCAAGLELLRTVSPKHYDRVRRHAVGIVVLGEGRLAGRWLQAPRLIQLYEAWLLDPDTQARDVAATIVHEATHAWLAYHGIMTTSERRQRIEAICFRSEAAFARCLPDGEEMATLYEDCASGILAEPAAEWSDEALRRAQVQDLRDLGVPKWFVNSVVRISTKLPNVRCS